MSEERAGRGYSIVVVVSIMKDQVRSGNGCFIYKTFNHFILKQVSTYSIKGLKTAYVSGEVTDKSVLDEVSQGISNILRIYTGLIIL